jgi:ArsR family transcriptional regulator
MRRYAQQEAGMDREVGWLKAVAEANRLRLLVLLARNGETCVCKLAAALGAPQFRVSRHLAVLRACGAVAARREGTWMHYRLAAPRTRLEACLQACLQDCLGEEPTVREDQARLVAAGCRNEDVPGHDRRCPRRKGT